MVVAPVPPERFIRIASAVGSTPLLVFSISSCGSNESPYFSRRRSVNADLSIMPEVEENGDEPAPASAPQIRFPLASVSIESQFCKVFTLKPPAVTLTPPSKVEVAAEVDLILPPLIVRPAEEAKLTADNPPEKVEVATEVLSSDPPVMVMPLAEAKPPPPVTERPPSKVDVPPFAKIVEVEVPPI